MKTIKAVLIAAGAIGMLQGITSCSSDPNPTDYFNRNHNQKAYIQLDLSVAETRAGFTAEDEMKVTKVNIYVFNDAGVLETTKNDQLVTVGESITFEASSGMKTIYAISAKQVVTPVVGTTTLADFEKSLFSSTYDDLVKEGFVMIGKSKSQYVAQSADQNTLPPSNIFTIDLTRAVAKAQVVFPESLGGPSSITEYGFRCFTPSYLICQTNNKMRIVNDGTDIWSKYTDTNNNGRYAEYADSFSTEYTAAVNEFTGDNCQYASENIVASPVAGNTTYVSLMVPQAPQYQYTFADGDKKPVYSTVEKANAETFYIVGIVDAMNGFTDYAVDASDPADKHIIAFYSVDDANRYCAALNGGDANGVTVSELDTPMGAPAATRAGEKKFEVLTFEDGNVYYRINIAHLEGEDGNKKKTYKVVRNKFYKITVNAVNSLGFSTQDLLRPTNPTAELDTKTSAWISTNFNVVDWEEVEQDVEL